MIVRIDLPFGSAGFQDYVELPAVPCEDDLLTYNGIERRIRHVIWHVGLGEEPWVQVILRPEPGDATRGGSNG